MADNDVVTGVDELNKNLKEFRLSMDRNMANAIIKGGRLVQSRTIKRLTKSGGIGQWVKRYHKGQAPYDHVASVPGQAPNSDTGELVSGIQLEVKDGDVYVGVESAQDAKANALEKGKADGTLQPRPFLFPSFEESKPNIEKYILKAAEQAVEDGNKKVGKVLKASKNG